VWLVKGTSLRVRLESVPLSFNCVSMLGIFKFIGGLRAPLDCYIEVGEVVKETAFAPNILSSGFLLLRLRAVYPSPEAAPEFN